MNVKLGGILGPRNCLGKGYASKYYQHQWQGQMSQHKIDYDRMIICDEHYPLHLTDVTSYISSFDFKRNNYWGILWEKG